MSRALHDPEHGYYGNRIAEVGLRGDFTTAPMLSLAPARAIAAWAAAALAENGCRTLIELGPGEGRLAGAVMAHLPEETRRRTRLRLVETSSPLRARQQRLLGSRACWHTDLSEALDCCEGRAVIYSNELVDAFPVRRFRLTAEGWREIGVQFQGEVFQQEVLLPEGPLPESSAFAQDFPVGQRIEVHESYRLWLARWMPDWQAGRLLTIDYGAESGSLYHRQPQGTIRAYLGQKTIQGEGIYHNVGRQDLTADVNFSDLIEWSRCWSQNCRLRSFAEFLRDFIEPGNPADEALADVPGPGDAFRVLDQRRSF